MNTPITFKHILIAAGIVVLYVLLEDHYELAHVVQFLSHVGV